MIRFSDYFVTAVRTGSEGIFGISMILIERGPGVTTKLVKTSYSPVAGTALVIFENVKVPVGNLLSEENLGFYLIKKPSKIEHQGTINKINIRCW